MKNRSAVNEGIIFSSCIFVSALIAYLLMGLNGALWATIACIYAFNLFNAQKTFKNYYYIGIGFVLMFISAAIGYFLKIGVSFCLALTLFSFFYYQMYGKDTMLDLTMKFMILISVVASVLPEVNLTLFGGFFLGGTVTTFSCYTLSQKEHLNLRFLSSLMDKSLFRLPQYIFFRALTYSIGLLLSLTIPLYLELGHFYWAALTYIFVLHPKSVQIMKVTYERTLGCFLSVVMLFFILQVPLMPYLGCILVLLCAFLLPISYRGSYVFITFVTTTLILSLLELIAYGNNPQSDLLFYRILETILGGIIAILISFILNRFREKTPVPDQT